MYPGYPTAYANDPDDRVLDLFRTENWQRLTFRQRLDACQEVANRHAAAHDAPPCRVRTAPLTGAVCGEERYGTITLNQTLVERGVFLSRYTGEDGRTVEVPVEAPAPNWNILDTVFHESTHGLQEFEGRMDTSYADPDVEYDLYRIQPNEKEAFAEGQYRTLEAIQQSEARWGRDAGTEPYCRVVRNTSFAEALANAQTHYRDPAIEVTLARAIRDRDRGIFPSDPSPSYQAVRQVLDQEATRQQIRVEVVEQDSGPALPDLPENSREPSEELVEDGARIEAEPMPPEESIPEFTWEPCPGDQEIPDGAALEDLPAGPDNAPQAGMEPELC